MGGPALGAGWRTGGTLYAHAYVHVHAHAYVHVEVHVHVHVHAHVRVFGRWPCGRRWMATLRKRGRCGCCPCRIRRLMPSAAAHVRLCVHAHVHVHVRVLSCSTRVSS